MKFRIDRRGQRILSLILMILLVWMLMPMASLPRAELVDPIGEAMSDLGEIKLGDGQDGAFEIVDATNPSMPQENEPRETQPPDETATRPPETEPPQTQPPETEPPETEPPETEPPETEPEQIPETQPDVGDGQDGQENGNHGEEGGEEAQPELALVMTWMRYGSQRATIVCGPSETVYKSMNTAQLINSELQYSFSLTGEAAEGYTVDLVEVKAGDGNFSVTGKSGSVRIDLPGGGERDYTFRIRCTNGAGEELVFTFVLHCGSWTDLELELSWLKQDGTADALYCAPNDTAAKTVKSRDLTEHVFGYTPKLTGAAAEMAAITGGSFTTDSGLSGTLMPQGGSMVLTPGETYYLTFEVQSEDMTLYFRFTIAYSETADVTVSFTWLERGSIPRTLMCMPDEDTSLEVRNNQLSAGAVKYEMELTGDDAENARILNISYTSASGGGKLEMSGAIPMTLPSGAAENVYTVMVSVLVNGQQLRYEIRIRYTMDVSLEMICRISDQEMRTIVCENGKTKTAEAIYDDMLTDGMISYEMKLTGSAGSALKITSVRCYQSGSGRTVSLDESDSIQLLLKNGKTGDRKSVV